jgi:hypothetical protein
MRREKLCGALLRENEYVMIVGQFQPTAAPSTASCARVLIPLTSVEIPQ